MSIKVNHPSAAPAPRVGRIGEVCQLAKLSRSSIYAMEANGLFPRRIKLGERASAWILDEVESWLRDRIAASRAAA